MKNPPRIEIFCRGDGLWGWRLRASNKKIIAIAGEGFFSQFNAKRAARSMHQNFLHAVFPDAH